MWNSSKYVLDLCGVAPLYPSRSKMPGHLWKMFKTRKLLCCKMLVHYFLHQMSHIYSNVDYCCKNAGMKVILTLRTSDTTWQLHENLVVHCVSLIFTLSVVYHNFRKVDTVCSTIVFYKEKRKKNFEMTFFWIFFYLLVIVRTGIFASKTAILES